VNFVSAVSAELTAVPAVSCEPLQPPDAVQSVAFSLVQSRWTIPPDATVVTSLCNFTPGPGATLIEYVPA
jgi:hypothetical protein